MNTNFIAQRFDFHTETIVKAAADRIFPLLCPVRESEWIPDWTYRLVFSRSGVAEKDCVFLTQGPGEPPTVWVNSLHDPQGLKVEYIRITSGIRVVRLRLELTSLSPDTSRMDFDFAFTSLGETGNREVNKLIEENGRDFRELSARLTSLLNDFLNLGKMVQ